MTPDELQVFFEDKFQKMKQRHEEEKQILITMDKVRNLIEQVLKMKPFAVPGYPESYSEYNLGWQGAAEMIDSMLVTAAATGDLWKDEN